VWHSWRWWSHQPSPRVECQPIWEFEATIQYNWSHLD
jgi:hypothetical protein